MSQRKRAAARKADAASAVESNIDWDALQTDWESGLFSNRALAEAYGCSEAAVSKKSKGDKRRGIPPWQRAAAPRLGAVDAAAQNDIARRAIERARRKAAGGAPGGPPSGGAAAPSAPESAPQLPTVLRAGETLHETLAGEVGGVVEQHRQHAARALSIGRRLQDELDFLMQNLTGMRTRILEHVQEQAKAKAKGGRPRRHPPELVAMMLHANITQQAADIYKTLSAPDATYIDLERIANGLAKGQDGGADYDDLIRELEQRDMLS